MGGHPSRFCFPSLSKLVSWIFGATALLALAGTAHAAAEIRIEPTSLYFGAAGPSSGVSPVSARPKEVSDGLPAPGIRAEALKSLREKAAGQSMVRVIARLAVPFTPEGRQSSALAVRDQRLAIGQVQATVLKKLEKERAKLHARFEYIPFLALEVDAKALELLASLPEVNGLEEDVRDKPALASSTAVIGAGVAWASGWTGDGKVVAVLDTGVDKTHPFFSSASPNKVVSEACYSSNVINDTTSVCPGGVEESTAPGSGVPCTDYYSDCDHGTMVAGIAAGDNGAGPGFGVARGADVISVQVFSSCSTSGYCIESWASDQIKGLERIYALASQYDIAAVSLSLEGYVYTSRSSCDVENVARKAAIDNLRSIDIPTIAPSGNGGYKYGISAPGCISSAVGVGATDDTDEVFYYSNIASYLDLLAPGVSIDSPVPGGGSANVSGTSMAAAHVAGAWAVLKQANPTATVSGVLGLLRDSAVPVREFGYDLRRINLGRAVGAPLEIDQFTIYNDGSSVLAVQSMQLQTPASWIRWSPEAPFDVPPGGSKTVKVSVDFGGAPAGSSTNRLVVASNDADESPYPGAVFLTVDKQPCYLLTRTRTGGGSGGNPVPGLASSPGCPVGQYYAGQLIPLSAQPSTGSVFVAWSGTNNDGSTALTNSVTMPAGPRTVSAAYQALCYALTRTHTGSGADPVASPASSPGCPAGQYHYAERIELTASPALYWRVGSWTNTAADNRHVLINSLSMPASPLIVTVNYSQGLPGVLVVNASFSDYDFPSYTQAVQASGRVYDVWDVETEGNPDAATLAAYPRVVWYPGSYGTLTSAQEQVVSAYLNGGGNLFLSGREYSYYGANTFLQSYLGVGYSETYTYYYRVTGQGPVFGGLGTYEMPYSSGRGNLSPAPGAQVIFRYDDEYDGPGNAGISKVGPGYRTVFLGFPFEGLPTPGSRTAVMSESLDFLGTVFEDVQRGHWSKKWVEALYRNGVTQGCGLSPRLYCPEGPVTREQMAIFLLRAKEGSSYTPPPCAAQPFGDVSAGSPYCPWIKELVARGITNGCGNGNYCPGAPVPREQMAFFLLKTLEGPGYTLPACTDTPFLDVPVGNFFCPWIKELVQRGFTTGCGGGNYCPGQSVTRAQTAVFLVRTFGLPLF